MLRPQVVALCLAGGVGSLSACALISGGGPPAATESASTDRQPNEGVDLHEAMGHIPSCDADTYQPKAVEWPIPRAVVASVDAADMNADGFPDIVMAEGSDVQGAEGYLRVVWNPARPEGPTWVSAKRDSWFRVRTVDMNFDGLPDIVGTLYRPRANNPNPEPPSDLALVYMSGGGRIPTAASTVLRGAGDLIGSGVVFADVTGDNRLDVGLLVTTPASHRPQPLKFYAADDDGVSTEPVWTSDTKIDYQAAARVADVDGDGALDVLVASEMIQAPSGGVDYMYVFRGRVENGRYELSTTADTWTYPTHQTVVATTLDVTAATGGLRTLIGFNDQFCPDFGERPGSDRENPACDGPLIVTTGNGAQREEAPWRHMWGTAGFLWVAPAATAVFGAHWTYTLDQYGNKERHPGPAVLYCGPSDDLFRDAVPLTPGATYLSIDSAVADFDRHGANQLRRQWTTQGWTQGFDLPTRVFDVLEVTVNGRPLSRDDYAVTPGARAISFAPPLAPGGHLELLLAESRSSDIAIADVNPDGRESIPIILQTHHSSLVR